MSAVQDGDLVQIVIRFNDALNARDLNAVTVLLAEDCIFENTFPPPDGTRYTGRPAVSAFWAEFFRSSANPEFEIEEIFAAGERVVMRWLYRWGNFEDNRGHVRGVDLYRVTGGLITEKLSYVKG
jgi:ketosteroid isomerase-like protein